MLRGRARYDDVAYCAQEREQSSLLSTIRKRSVPSSGYAARVSSERVKGGTLEWYPSIHSQESNDFRFRSQRHAASLSERLGDTVRVLACRRAARFRCAFFVIDGALVAAVHTVLCGLEQSKQSTSAFGMTHAKNLRHLRQSTSTHSSMISEALRNAHLLMIA